MVVSRSNIDLSKVAGHFFPRNDRNVGIDGVTPSLFVPGANRIGRRNSNKEKITNDQQFTGKGYYAFSNTQKGTFAGNSNFNWGTGNWKIRVICRFGNVTGYNTVISSSYTQANGWWLGAHDGALWFMRGPGGSLIGSYGVINVGEWYEITVERKNLTDIYITINGTEYVASPSDLNTISFGTDLLDIVLAGDENFNHAVDLGLVEVFKNGSQVIGSYFETENTSVENVCGPNATISNYLSGNWNFDLPDELSYSHLNEKGYNVSGSDVIPASLTNPTQDILGNPLLFKGRVAPKIQLKNSPCINLDGINQYIPFGNVSAFEVDNFIIRAYAVISSHISTETIFSWQCDTAFICGGYLRWQNGNISLYFNGASYNASVLETISTIPKEVIAIKNGTNLTVLVDREERINTTVDADIAYNHGQPLSAIGARGNTGNYALHFNGKIAGIVFCDYTQANYDAIIKGENPPTSLLNMPLSEGNGLSVLDISGNENHSVIQNGSLPQAWASQNKYHFGFLYGYQRVLLLNGIDQEITTGPSTLPSFSTFGYKLVCRFTEEGGEIVNLVAENNYYHLRVVSSSEIHIIRRSNDTSHTNLATGLFIDRKRFYELEIKFTSNTSITIVLDGVEHQFSSLPSVTIDALSGQSATFVLGSFNGTLYNRVEIASAELLLDDVPYYSYNIKDGSDTFENKQTADVPVKLSNYKEASYVDVPFQLTEEYYKGYSVTGKYNGAGDIEVPNVPGVPSSLRGKTISGDVWNALGKLGHRVIQSKGDILLKSSISNKEMKRLIKGEAYEPEVSSWYNYTALYMNTHVSLDNYYELDRLIKGIKIGHQLELGVNNLNTIFPFFIVHALDLPTETYNESLIGQSVSLVPRRWAVDIANLHHLKEQTGAPSVGFVQNGGIKNFASTDRLSINGFDLSDIAASNVVGHKDIELGYFFTENTNNYMNWVFGGYNNSDQVGLRAGIEFQSATSGRIVASINSTTVHYSPYFNPLNKVVSVKRIGDKYYIYLDGILVDESATVVSGAIPTEQWFGYLSNGYSGGSWGIAICLEPIAMSYIGAASRVNSQVVSECFKDYYNKRNSLWT